MENRAMEVMSSHKYTIIVELLLPYQMSPRFNTFRVRGFIHEQHVTILIDGGETHIYRFGLGD